MLTLSDSTRGVSVPAWAVGLGAPAIVLVLMALYADLALLPSGGRSGDLSAQTSGLAKLFVVYAAGYGMFSIVRSQTSRDAALKLALCLFAGGVIVVLFSFGIRAAGAVACGLSLGGFAATVPARGGATPVRLTRPGRGAVLYTIGALLLPLALGNALAARNYSTSGNPVSETFGIVWMLFGLYAFGYAFWSYVRTVSQPVALFSASFAAFWGLPFGMVLASLGPLALLPFIAGIGGVVASLPYFWSRLDDDLVVVRAGLP